jgi:hypothetical protein
MRNSPSLKKIVGCEKMPGHDLPGPAAALKFLYRFHDAAAIAQAQQELLWAR